MDLALGFEDDDIISDKLKAGGDHHKHYNVKLCTPKWFDSKLTLAGSIPKSDQGCQETENISDNLLQLVKFSADFHYHKENYGKAAQQFEILLENLPETSVSLRQDAKESLARAYMHSGCLEKSLQLARALLQELCLCDEARHRQALLLLAAVGEKTGNWSECITSLEKLCGFQPHFPQHWMKLGDAHIGRLTTNQSEAEEDSIHASQVAALNSYGRAKYLLESVIANVSSLVKTRNSILIQELSHKMDAISISSEEKEQALKCLREEVEHKTAEH